MAVKSVAEPGISDNKEDITARAVPCIATLRMS